MAGEHLKKNSARNTERGGQPTGKMTSSAIVLITAVAKACRIVCVSWSGYRSKLIVIGRSRIPVPDYRGKRTPAGFPVKETTQKLRLIFFPPCSGPVMLPGCTPQQKSLKSVRIYLKEGRAKLEIALAKGKNLYDKRQDQKLRDAKREMEKALKLR